MMPSSIYRLASLVRDSDDQEILSPHCHAPSLLSNSDDDDDDDDVSQCFTVPHLFRPDSLDSGESGWNLVECRRTSNKRI